VNEKHPGKIELVDEVRGTTEVVPASSAPATVAFVDGKPVVRIVHSKRGADVIIRSYGVDGSLLQSTVGRSG
jgi:hypothetical protein